MGNTEEEEEEMGDEEDQVSGEDAEMDRSLREAVKGQKEEEEEGPKRRRVVVVRMEQI